MWLVCCKSVQDYWMLHRCVMADINNENFQQLMQYAAEGTQIVLWTCFDSFLTSVFL